MYVYIPYSTTQHKGSITYECNELLCATINRAYMILTEVVRETTLIDLVFQVPKYTHPTRVGYQDL